MADTEADAMRKQAAHHAANAESSRVLSINLYREAENTEWLADHYIQELEQRVQDLETFTARWATNQ